MVELAEEFYTYPEVKNLKQPPESGYLKNQKEFSARVAFLKQIAAYDVKTHFTDTIKRTIIKPPFLALTDDEILAIYIKFKTEDLKLEAHEVPSASTPEEIADKIKKNPKLALLTKEAIDALIRNEKIIKTLRNKSYSADEFHQIQVNIDEKLSAKFKRETQEVSCLVNAFKNLSSAEFEDIRKKLSEAKFKEKLQNISPKLLGYIQALTTDRSLSSSYPFTITNFQKATFNPVEVQAMLDILNSNEATKHLAKKIEQKRRVKMSELLGKDGVSQFQAALKEERDSDEFRRALWAHSVKAYDFEKPKNTFLYLILSGASGAGKSTSGKQAIERELRNLGAKQTAPGKGEVYLAWIDGGIARELNHMQKVVKYLCIEHGIEVTDLYSNSSKILDETKKRIQEAVTQEPSTDIGIVIPETYSSPTIYDKDLNTIRKIEQELNKYPAQSPVNVHVAYDFVVGINIGRHPKIVKLMAERRAFDPASTQAKNFKTFHAAKSNEPFLTTIWNQFIQSIGLAEGKAYGPSGYLWGSRGSLSFFRRFGEEETQNINIKRYFNCNDVDIFTQEGEPWDFDKEQEGEPVVASRRLLKDWENNNEGMSLKDYADKNWRNYPNIMIEYNPGKLNLTFAQALEDTIEKNLKNKSSLFFVFLRFLGSMILGSQRYEDFASAVYTYTIAPILNLFNYAKNSTESAEEGFEEQLDDKEQDNLELQLKLLQEFNELHDTDAFNDLSKIQQSLKKIRELEAQKFEKERLEILDNFRTQNTLNLLVEARMMLEKRQELLLQLDLTNHKKDAFELLELPLKEENLLEEKTDIKEIFSAIDTFNSKDDYDEKKYPDHIFSRLKILINKRFESKKNLKYLLALDRIIGQIDANNIQSVEDGLSLLEQLKIQKEQDESGFFNSLFRTKNQTTVPLIKEVQEYYSRRYKTLEIGKDPGKGSKDLIKKALAEQLKRPDGTAEIPSKIKAILKHPALTSHQGISAYFKESNVPADFKNLVEILSELTQHHDDLIYVKVDGGQNGADLLEHLNTNFNAKLLAKKNLTEKFALLLSTAIEVLKLKQELKSVENIALISEIETKLKDALAALNAHLNEHKQQITEAHREIREELREKIAQIYATLSFDQQEVIEEKRKEIGFPFNDLEELGGMSNSTAITSQSLLIEEHTNQLIGLYVQALSEENGVKAITKDPAELLTVEQSIEALDSIIVRFNREDPPTYEEIENLVSSIPNDVCLIELVEQLMVEAKNKGLIKAEEAEEDCSDTSSKSSEDTEADDEDLRQILVKRIADISKELKAENSLDKTQGLSKLGPFLNDSYDLDEPSSVDEESLMNLYLRAQRIWIKKRVEVEDQDSTPLNVEDSLAALEAINEKLSKDRITTTAQEIYNLLAKIADKGGLLDDVEKMMDFAKKKGLFPPSKIQEIIAVREDLLEKIEAIKNQLTPENVDYNYIDEQLSKISNLAALDTMKDIEANTNKLMGIYLDAQVSKIWQNHSSIKLPAAAELLSYEESNAELELIKTKLSKETTTTQEIYDLLSIIANDYRLIDLVEQVMAEAVTKGLIQAKVSHEDNLSPSVGEMKPPNPLTHVTEKDPADSRSCSMRKFATVNTKVPNAVKKFKQETSVLHERLRNEIKGKIKKISGTELGKTKSKDRYEDLLGLNEKTGNTEIYEQLRIIDKETEKLVEQYIQQQIAWIEAKVKGKFVRKRGVKLSDKESIKALKSIISELSKESPDDPPITAQKICSTLLAIKPQANEKFIEKVEEMMQLAKSKDLFREGVLNTEDVPEEESEISNAAIVKMRGGGRASVNSLSRGSVSKSSSLLFTSRPPAAVVFQGVTKSVDEDDASPVSSELTADFTDVEDGDFIVLNYPSVKPLNSLDDLKRNLDGIKREPINQGESKTLRSASGQEYQFKYDKVASASLQTLPKQDSELDQQKLCLTIISMINNILLHHEIVAITTEDKAVQQYAKDYIAYFNEKTNKEVTLKINGNPASIDKGLKPSIFNNIAKSPGSENLIPTELKPHNHEDDESLSSSLSLK